MDEADLPIDIHCSKLLEWLISRQHCPRNWQTLLPDLSKSDQKSFFEINKIYKEKGYDHTPSFPTELGMFRYN